MDYANIGEDREDDVAKPRGLSLAEAGLFLCTECMGDICNNDLHLLSEISGWILHVSLSGSILQVPVIMKPVSWKMTDFISSLCLRS